MVSTLVNNPSRLICDPEQAVELLAVTIQNTSTDGLQDYPVKVLLDKNNFDFTLATSDGHDLAVWDKTSKLSLPFWLESYDSQTGKAILWVKTSITAGASQVVWITTGTDPRCSVQPSNGYSVFPFFSDVQDAKNWKTENHLSVTNTITTNPISIQNRQVIVGDGTYNSTPGLAEAANGDWVLTYRKGIAHLNVPLVIVRRSQDKGKTWGPETAYWNTSGPDPALVRTPGGDLLIAFVKHDSNNLAGAAYSRSSDNGVSWAPFTFLEHPADHTSVFSPTLYTSGSTMYGLSYGTSTFDADASPFYWQSFDDGRTWTKVSELRNAGDPGLNETAAAQTGSHQIFAVMRDDDSANTYGRYSSDQGLTWGPLINYTKQLGVIQGPQFIQMGNTLLLLAREAMPSALSNAAGVTRQLVAFVSKDGGKTFDRGTVLETYTGGFIDGGYSWPLLLPDGKVYVAYYADSHNQHQPDIKSLVINLQKPVTTASNALHILGQLEAGRASQDLKLSATRYAVEFSFRSKQVPAGSQFSVTINGSDASGGSPTLVNWELPSVHVPDPTITGGLFMNNQFIPLLTSFTYDQTYRVRTLVDENQLQQEGQLLDPSGVLLKSSGKLPLAQGVPGHISGLTIGNNSSLRTTDTLLDFIFVRQRAAYEPQVTVSRVH